MLFRSFVTQRLSDKPIVPISGIAGAELLSPLSTRETAIGIQSAVSSNTDVTSRMQLDRGLNGTDAFALVGTRTRIPVRKGFGVDWGFDRAQRVQGNGRDYTSGSVGLAYMPGDYLRSSVTYELRSRETVGAAIVHQVLSSRHVADAVVWRHRPRPLHCRAASRAHGRVDQIGRAHV